jgi:molybdopterin-guanine dinucleotide biosynthesis protein A
VSKPDTVFGLVLAGGRSRRMGHDKALLQQDGRSQLQRAVDVLQESLDEVYVSTRADQAEESERSRYAQIVDRYEDMGPLAGILSAMESHPGAGWIVLACDLPNINSLTVKTLLENRSEEQPFTAYESSYDQLPEPLCAYYSPQSQKVIRQFIDDGIVCPRKIMIRSDSKMLQQPDPTALDNINTPEDLAGHNIQAAT